MARSINTVTLLGNITRDPELRVTPNGQSVVNVSIALNHSYKDKAGEWQEVTDYIDIIAWAKLAETVANNVSKGSRILVQGRLQSRQWEQDGKKHIKVEVLASDILFMDARTKSDAPKQSLGDDFNESINLSDIPF